MSIDDATPSDWDALRKKYGCWAEAALVEEADNVNNPSTLQLWQGRVYRGD